MKYESSPSDSDPQFDAWNEAVTEVQAKSANAQAEAQTELREEKHKLKIMTCIGSAADYSGDMPYGLDMMLKSESGDKLAFPTHEHIDNISFRAKDSLRLKEGLITGGDGQYVMSGVDTRDKFSSGFYGCLGLVVVGTDKSIRAKIYLWVCILLYTTLT